LANYKEAKGVYRQKTTDVGSFQPNVLAYMTCTEMSGNGAPIKIIEVRPHMNLVIGYLTMKRSAFCAAAAPGTTIPVIVAAPSASAMGRAAGPLTSVYV